MRNYKWSKFSSEERLIWDKMCDWCKRIVFGSSQNTSFHEPATHIPLNRRTISSSHQKTNYRYLSADDFMSLLSDNKFPWNTKQENILTNCISDMSQAKNVEATYLSTNFEDNATVAFGVTHGVPDRFDNIGTKLSSSVDFRNGIDETIMYELSIKSQDLFG